MSTPASPQTTSTGPILSAPIAMAAPPSRASALPAFSPQRRRHTLHPDTLAGYLFASPWIIGFLVFTLVPIGLSLWYSLCRYDVLRPPMYIGLENYRALLLEPGKFYHALWNTVFYTALRVPLVIVGSLLLASLMARPMPGISFARTILYAPSIVSGVALSLIWLWLYNPTHGLINRALALVGIPGPLWLENPRWSKPAIILMGLWSLGGARMIVFIAGLNGVPRHLYEAARVDGAGWWAQLRHITLPQMSGLLFMMTVVEVIGSFQVFAEAYLMTQGAPLDSTLFYNLELYFRAFRDYNMGLASAMAWLLFAFTLAVTLLLFRISRRFVYYESDTSGGAKR